MDSFHRTIALAVSSQVEQMISEAQRNSEARVRTEVARIRQDMQTMNERISHLADKLQFSTAVSGDAADATSSGGGKEALAVLQRLEQQHNRTMGELQTEIQHVAQVQSTSLKTLKHELHQTIQAHNHNADLMKRQKGTVDAIRQQLETFASARLVANQLHKVESQLGRDHTAVNQKLETLTRRVQALEAQISGGLPPAGSWNWGVPPFLAGADSSGWPASSSKGHRGSRGRGGGGNGAQGTPKNGKPAGGASSGAAALASAAAGAPTVVDPELRADAQEFVPQPAPSKKDGEDSKD
jgi:hypothetical protein